MSNIEKYEATINNLRFACKVLIYALEFDIDKRYEVLKCLFREIVECEETLEGIRKDGE